MSDFRANKCPSLNSLARTDFKPKYLDLYAEEIEDQKYYELKSEQEIISSLLQELDQMFDGKATGII